MPTWSFVFCVFRSKTLYCHCDLYGGSSSFCSIPFKSCKKFTRWWWVNSLNQDSCHVSSLPRKVTKGSTSSSLGSKPMARPSKERIETHQKKRLSITVVYRWCWKGGNTIPQTWGLNSGDLFFMTQAYSSREDELVEICVTVIYTQLSLFHGLHLILYIYIQSLLVWQYEHVGMHQSLGLYTFCTVFCYSSVRVALSRIPWLVIWDDLILLMSHCNRKFECP